MPAGSHHSPIPETVLTARLRLERPRAEHAPGLARVLAELTASAWRRARGAPSR